MKLRESNTKKHKNILIVPSHGANIRRMRVKRRFIVVLIAVTILGFAGYFVPFNHLSIDVVEQKHKQSLDEQNSRIAADIKSMRRNLGDLNGELKTLERKKQKISDISGMNDPLASTTTIRKHTRRQLKSADTLYAVTSRAYLLFSALMRPVSQNAGAASIFDRFPVSRPVRGIPCILSGYGMKKDPFTGGDKMHYGIDFVVPQRDPVIATASGRIIVVDHSAMWGYRVVIQHGYGFSSVYAHLGSVCVHSGENVVRGKRVGTAGQSGLTTGVHVHYELLKNGKNVNPQLYFFPDWAQSKS